MKKLGIMMLIIVMLASISLCATEAQAQETESVEYVEGVISVKKKSNDDVVIFPDMPSNHFHFQPLRNKDVGCSVLVTCDQSPIPYVFELRDPKTVATLELNGKQLTCHADFDAGCADGVRVKYSVTNEIEE